MSVKMRAVVRGVVIICAHHVGMPWGRYRGVRLTFGLDKWGPVYV